MSKTKNLMNTILQDRNGRYFSYLRGKTRRLLVEVSGHVRSPDFELNQKDCKHDISM